MGKARVASPAQKNERQRDPKKSVSASRQLDATTNGFVGTSPLGQSRQSQHRKCTFVQAIDEGMAAALLDDLRRRSAALG
jgi:hypothetical protein